MLRSRRYLAWFALPGLIAAAALGLSYLVLNRAGETINLVDAAKIQQDTDITYGSALFYRPRPYKTERALLVKADTVLLGSSRAMQFIGTPWKEPTYNAGGAMRDIASGEVFVDRLLDVYHPKRVIITLDWWWFTSVRQADEPMEGSPETSISLHELTQPVSWMWNGIFSADQMSTLLFEPGTLKPAIGMSAHFRHAGWNAFGHYDYGDRLSKPASGPDIRFEESLDDLQSRSKRNDAGPWIAFSPDHWQRLEALVKRLQDAGAEVILLMPPVAGPVYDWLAAQPEPNLVKEVGRHLGTLPALTFDFTDPKTIGSDPCEFVDGRHGGEVTYLRMLDAVAADPSADLETAVDRPLMQQLIAANAGHATLKRDDPDRQPEADFNDLGCKK